MMLPLRHAPHECTDTLPLPVASVSFMKRFIIVYCGRQFSSTDAVDRGLYLSALLVILSQHHFRFARSSFLLKCKPMTFLPSLKEFSS